MGSAVAVPRLRSCGPRSLVAAGHVGSSGIRDQKLCLLNWQADPSSLSPQGNLFLFFFFSGRQGREEGKGGGVWAASAVICMWTAHGFVLASMTLLWQEKMCVTEARISLFLTICLSELFTVLRRTIQISVTDITRTKDFTFIAGAFQRVTVDVPTTAGDTGTICFSPYHLFWLGRQLERPCPVRDHCDRKQGDDLPHYGMN